MDTKRPSKHKYALLVGILGSFYPGFAGSAMNLAIPQMGADFGMGAAGIFMSLKRKNV